MKSRIALVVVLFAPMVFAQGAYVANYSNAPIYMALDDYGRWTGVDVEVVREVAWYAITFTGQADTAQQAAELVRAGLAATNVGLFPFASNRVVATWIVRPDRISRAPDSYWQSDLATKVVRPISIADRLRQRREALERMRSAATNPPVAYAGTADVPELTKEERMRKLREYNQELIKAKGAKGPPLPIQLTPEEDAQLVKDGILAPMTDRPAAPATTPTNSPTPPAER